MKKVFLIICKLVVWTIIGLFSTIFALVFLLGLAEGDLSQGLFYYLK